MLNTCSWHKQSNFRLIFKYINIVSDLVKGDGGLYTCVASSRSGKATWSATLRLESPTNPNIAFFRSPETTTLPGPPSRPLVVSTTHNSLTISWTRNNKIGSSSLLGYQVKTLRTLYLQYVCY